MVLEKNIFFNVLSNCKVMRANDHRDVAILGHMRMLCGTYVKLHVTMLHTKYRSFGSFGSREIFFYVFPIVRVWQAMTPWGRSCMDPRGRVDRIYKEGYYALLHTKILKLLVLWFRRKGFVHVFLL